MDRTYTLTATLLKGGKHSGWTNNTWGSYTANTSLRCQGGGGSDKSFAAVFIMFDENELANLRTKTIKSVTLRVNVKSGYIPASGAHAFPVSYKYTNTNNSWQRGNLDSTSTGTVVSAYLENASGGTSKANNTIKNLTLRAEIPKYGYVIGPNSYSVSASLYLNDEATLTVVTDEADLWVKGSDNTMHQAAVYVKGSDNAMYQGSVYVKGSDDAMHRSS